MDRSSDNLGQTISNIQRDLEELKSNQGQGGGGGGGGGEDTGWVDLRPYMVSTNVYEARPGNYYPKARRINGIVYLSGEIYCKVSVGVMTSILLENIPEIFVPDTPEGQANGSGVCYELSNSYYMIFIETMANGKGRIRISQPYTKTPSTGNYQGYSLNGISPYPGK